MKSSATSVRNTQACRGGERPVEVKAGKETFELTTDKNGVLRLNLLDSPFAEYDLNHLGKLQISVDDSKGDA